MRLSTRIVLLESTFGTMPARHLVFDFDRLGYVEVGELQALIETCGPAGDRDVNRLTKVQRIKMNAILTPIYDPLE